MILKKRLLLITILVLANLMLIPIITSVQAAWYVEVNDGFDFQILKCENKFELGNVTAEGFASSEKINRASVAQ